jgi:autophagy-related protein 9
LLALLRFLLFFLFLLLLLVVVVVMLVVFVVVVFAFAVVVSFQFVSSSAGIALALCRGFIPDENRVFNPAQLLRDIVRHTHYYPSEWKGAEGELDTLESFGKLFEYRVVCPVLTFKEGAFVFTFKRKM